MKKILGRLLCKLGRHDWVHVDDAYYGKYAECRRCGIYTGVWLGKPMYYYRMSDVE